MINVTASSSTITATAAATSVGAAVTQTTVSATASGGVGPAGEAASHIEGLQDVQLVGLSDGDVLRYSSTKWRNYSDSDLLDGGNF